MHKKQVRTAQERRQRNRAQMIEDILQIAREMMQADGVAGLNFNAIARRLGIKPPSLYTYFDSKHAIYDMLFRRGFEEFSHRMSTRPGRDSDFATNLLDAFTTYMNFALENPDLYQLMFQRPVPDFVPSDESMAVSLAALKRAREDMQRVLEQSGLDSNLPIDKANDLVIALMHGMTELQLANNPESPVGEGRFGRLISDAVTLFVRAWGTDPPDND